MHIGKPINNVFVCVLNEAFIPVPVKVVGELFVGGAGLARGYLNRDDLTREKFVVNPFYDPEDALSGERLYRTGDLVRWRADGHLEYVGRTDHQVKIRGFRIEPGEIENALRQLPSVKECFVMSPESHGEARYLVAFVVPEEGHSCEAGQLRNQLGVSLPDYMLPAAFVVLNKLPLNSNGKVDRNALPQQDMSSQQSAYVAPQTETEQLLCDIWQELLELPRVGVTDNFFHVGGHSLSGMRLISRINQHFGIQLSLRMLFVHQEPGALARVIDGMSTDVSVPAIEAVSRHQQLPLSFAQQRLWMLDQIENGSLHYNMPMALRLTGTLNESALIGAFEEIVRRHESLRTCFAVDDEGEPYQVILPESAFEVQMGDLSHLSGNAQADAVGQAAEEEALKAFDLAQDCMLRVMLLRLSENEQALLMTMHHIASDGWSMGVLIKEFRELYQAKVRGEDAKLSPLPIQYADYAHWQRNWLQGEVLDGQYGYWEKQLAGIPDLHSLPLDKPRPAIQSYAGRSYASHISSSVHEGLQRLCQQEGATLFMALHAAYSVLLSRYSNERDIVMGSPIANREQAEVSGLIGFFVNTLVLRSDLTGTPGFRDLLRQSRQMLLDAYAHQQVPFEQLVERLQPTRSLSHSPLFQVMLVLQNNKQEDLDLPELELNSVKEDRACVSLFDLTLNVIESPDNDGLAVLWEYNTDLFEAQSIERLAAHFEVLLGSLMSEPDKNVFSLPMLMPEETQKLLNDARGRVADYPLDKCVHELFEVQAATNPDDICVVYEDTQLSYGEVNRRANRLAHYLRTERGIVPDTLVGLCIERSVDMVIGILGILKAGGAYVPLDPGYPQERLEYMLEDAELNTVVTQHSVAEKLSLSTKEAVCLDEDIVVEALEHQPVHNLSTAELGLKPSHLAYVIYTSGSTGKPKGVLVEHNGLVNLAVDLQQRYSLTREDGLVQFAPVSFDMSVEEIFGAVCTGSRLIIRSDDWISSIAAFYEYCQSS
ncbi:MAG: AMP-binding protein, partial [Gammaproteobacteria bacterium]|nr:AMP-binding protein [Gammaproteobacteria bacterium]